ncbi:MAG: 16S rRNA (guanine(966)-N(2))-methyltransferase RsmD [Clostridia bacterium]|nr:16S rRNA (guanine(966)-N(2))-methyltransferase RsmD [Clostridia bacterium]
MIRVIAGIAGGMKLKTIDSDSTKPTLDRVKEAMFSMIYNWFPCENVLDLFSGNGSLGIEALSRGACRAVMNDKSKACCSVIKENLSHTGFSKKVDVYSKDFSELISVMRKEGRYFDLVLLDPPYGRGLIGETLCLLQKSGICGIPDKNGCRGDCIVVAEHSVQDDIKDCYGGFERLKCKKYGTVAVSVFILSRDKE